MSEAQRAELDKSYKQGQKAVFRQRCHYILLSDQGKTIEQIADFYQTNRMSIGKWFSRYEQQGVSGLKTNTGRGRKPLLSVDNAEHVAQVEQYLEQDCQDLKQTLRKLAEDQGLEMSKYTLKRFLKKLGTATSDLDVD
ncbi:MAG: helix-turn-helix domain-containing protein [Saprospiraceae bacterium]|nr:helix-turn-helix domain-containing protein [Lewinella sp.]